jgi:hypothetical protein
VGCFPSSSHKIVILRGCDFFDLFVFCAYPTSCISSPRQSRHPERSASQIRSRDTALHGAESKDPEDAYLVDVVRSFSTTEAREQDLLRYAFNGHGYIFSGAVIIFRPKVCARSLNGHSKMPASSWFSAAGKTVSGPVVEKLRAAWVIRHRRRTSAALILFVPFAPFQPPKPAPGLPATVFPGAENKNWQHLAMPGDHIYIFGSHTGTLHIGAIGLGGRKAPNSVVKVNMLGVLRLRAIKTSFCDRSAKRFAQDDGFVGG